MPEEEKPITVKPGLFATLYMLMVPVARAKGYCLSVHGSLNRDLDVVAVPWTEEAVSAEELVKALVEDLKLLTVHESDKPKPHGRRCWVLGWEAGLYVDLSILPRVVV